MKRPKYVSDAIHYDETNKIIGCFDDYILKPFYQPIYRVEQNKAVLLGYEGLIRPYIENTLIQPEKFFNIVDEKDALFVECLCLALHIRGFMQAVVKEGILFVNVNAGTYATIIDVEREFFYLFSQLSKHELNRDNIVFEILETEVADEKILIHLCQLIKANGYKLALDDFGTKHSNVERYISINPDIIKLDRTFVINAMKTKETTRLLQTLVRAFKDKDVSVIIEGIETDEEVSFALDIGADMLQGFYLGMPERMVSKNISEFNLRDDIDSETNLRIAV